MKEIDEIIQIQNEINKLQDRKNLLTKPKYTDFSYINELYKKYMRFQANKNLSHKGTYNACKFIYIVLYLYSPHTLAGGKTIPGIIKRLKECLDTSSGTMVSDYINRTRFFYKTYKEFRESIDELIKDVK